jgi:HPt (histidine-containing phosphotransfer) domain-containing protein
MPDELKAQLQELLSSAEASADEIASAIKAASQPVYQQIFDKGHSAATAAKSSDIETLQAEREQLQQERDALQSDLQELKKSTPDLDKWREEKEQALQRKEQEWKERYEGLQDKYHGEKRSAVRTGLVSELERRGLDSWTAQKAVDDSTLKRVRVEDDGLRFYQTDGETPLAVDSRDDAIKVLADEVYSQVPESLRKGPRQSFGGSKGGSAGSQQQFTPEQLDQMSDAEYAKHRKNVLASASES